MSQEMNACRSTSASSPSRIRRARLFVDYGGPNVAKPLHVGHLRSAPSSAESIKRIYRYLRQPGHRRHPSGRLGSADGPDHCARCSRSATRSFATLTPIIRGEYPDEAPFTISELEEIYPAASAKIEGGRSLCREGPQRDVFTPAGRARLPRHVEADHARFGGGPEEEL